MKKLMSMFIVLVMMIGFCTVSFANGKILNTSKGTDIYERAKIADELLDEHIKNKAYSKIESINKMSSLQSTDEIKLEDNGFEIYHVDINNKSEVEKQLNTNLDKILGEDFTGSTTLYVYDLGAGTDYTLMSSSYSSYRYIYQDSSDREDLHSSKELDVKTKYRYWKAPTLLQKAWNVTIGLGTKYTWIAFELLGINLDSLNDDSYLEQYEITADASWVRKWVQVYDSSIKEWGNGCVTEKINWDVYHETSYYDDTEQRVVRKTEHTTGTDSSENYNDSYWLFDQAATGYDQGYPIHDTIGDFEVEFDGSTVIEITSPSLF